MHPPVAAALLGAALSTAAIAQHPGYTDTPLLPGGKWRVHDANRPNPPVVDPGPASNLPTPAPKDAIVLFDGQDLSQWASDKGPARWVVQDGSMQVNGTGSIHTVQSFGSCQLHLEFATPSPATGDSQGRGNSGVFLMSRYEIQVLDSFENVTYADGQCAALYGQHPPLVNACRKPGEWQSYDILFVAPRFSADGKLLSPARATVLQNGIVVQLDAEFYGATGHRSEPHYQAHAAKAPIELQDHGNPMRFRNVWIRELQLPATPDAAKPAAK